MQANWCPWRGTWNQILPNDSPLSAQLLALLGLKSCCFQALGVGALWLSLSIFFFNICIYLATLGLNCSMQDPWSSGTHVISQLWHVGSVPWPGIKPWPPALEHGVLVTGPPETPVMPYYWWLFPPMWNGKFYLWPQPSCWHFTPQKEVFMMIIWFLSTLQLEANYG